MMRKVQTSFLKRVARCAALIASFAIAQSALAATWYVNINASSNGDGESWGTAFDNLHDALDNPFLFPGDHIWVAAGTYIPTKQSTIFGVSGYVFELPEEVRLYGGFAGTEASLGDRVVVDDLFVNETILTNPQGHVLAAENIGDGGDNFEGTRTMVNGFTIREASGIAVYMFNAAPVFVRCRFIENEREPVFADGNFDPEGANRGPEFINCQFIGNESGYKSAGVSLSGADGVFTNCLFADNVSDVCCGGGAVWLAAKASASAISTWMKRWTMRTSSTSSN